MKFEGKHYIASLKGIETNTSTFIYRTVLDALQLSNATILKDSYHTFPNGAVTFVILLAESHCSVHTFPEHDSLFLDLFTCGDNCNIEVFINYIMLNLQPKEIDEKFIERK